MSLGFAVGVLLLLLTGLPWSLLLLLLPGLRRNAMKPVMFERAVIRKLMSVGTDVGVPLPRWLPRWLLLLLYGL